MINDIPTINNNNTQTSIFADDSAVWKSGKNIGHLQSELQKQLNKIVEWCDTWGFKINETKTVVVPFTKNQHIATDQIKVQINGKELKIEKQAKFLGLIFDSQLTWKPHVEFLVGKCKTRINLMRNVSSQTWGASKKTLLTIYRALIRSRLEYGCQLFYTAAKTTLEKLDSVQTTCLRICCGAFKGTASSALQQDLGEIPLALKRQEMLLKLSIKIKITANNPASSILQDSWENHYGNYKEGCEPVYCIAHDYIERLERITEGPRISPQPPWHHLVNNIIDDSLTKQISKTNDSPEIMHAYALETIHLYTNTLHIYTDGSKTDEGRVGSAFCIPTLDIEEGCRITDHSTVYTAELTALKMALTWIIQAPQMNYTIFTDSLSSIQSLKTNKSDSKPNLLLHVKELIAEAANKSIRVQFVWIPSHVNLAGNERADKTAKAATEHTAIDLVIPFELKDAYADIKHYIDNAWQLHYNNGNTGDSYRILEPKVNRKIKYTCDDRYKDVTITRLRLGKCRLNSYLHRINCHRDGLCPNCNTPDTIEHLLLHCTRTQAPSRLQDICNTLGINFTVTSILKHTQSIDVAFECIKTLSFRL